MCVYVVLKETDICIYIEEDLEMQMEQREDNKDRNGRKLRYGERERK